MQDMDKTERLTIRLSKRERAKLDECSDLMGVSVGEFTRRCLQVMLMVMGDQEAKAAIYQILDEATGVMKMGAGLPPVPPKAGVTSTPLDRKGRKEKVGR